MLETYFIPELYQGYASYSELNFYMDKEVKYDTLSDEARLYYAYQIIKEPKRRWFDNCTQLKGYVYNDKDVYQTCVDSDSEIIKRGQSSEEWFFNDANKEKLEEAYHKIYGSSSKIPLKSFTMNFTGMCLYSENKDDFLCFETTGEIRQMVEVRQKWDLLF